MKRIFSLLFDIIIDKKRAPYIINYLASKHNINLLLHVYRTIGIHKVDFEWSGEKFFLEKALNEKLSSIYKPILFDVGANVGKYSLMLHSYFPNAEIYSFEPSSETFEKFTAEVGDVSSINGYNIALGSKKRLASLYKPKQEFSPHATLVEGVLRDLLNHENVEKENIPVETVDSFCKSKRISVIHFLKIDVEGHELEVLKGAKEMLNKGAIDVIQFEFNEMNIISRCFLKDFYDLLHGFHFYRLNTSELIPLGNYNSINEIFQFQNIVAIRR